MLFPKVGLCKDGDILKYVPKYSQIKCTKKAHHKASIQQLGGYSELSHLMKHLKTRHQKNKSCGHSGVFKAAYC